MTETFLKRTDNTQPPPRPARSRPAQQDAISCRATNPLSLHDDLNKVFLDENQAKATTATRMFRNNELWNAMTKVVLPAFLAGNRGDKFSMWSSGCSSGEEVYSMALVAIAEFEKNRRPPMLEAFGTDINRNRIVEARSGRYTRPGKDSISQNHWRILSAHADMDAHEIQMGPALMSACKFMVFDMRNKPKKHTFNFIVCNHVLQYYDGPGQKHIIANLKAALRPGGHLYLEGITAQGLEGTGLKKHATARNLFAVDNGRGSMTTRISRIFFKK